MKNIAAAILRMAIFVLDLLAALEMLGPAGPEDTSTAEIPTSAAQKAKEQAEFQDWLDNQW